MDGRAGHALLVEAAWAAAVEALAPLGRRSCWNVADVDAAVGVGVDNVVVAVAVVAAAATALFLPLA